MSDNSARLAFRPTSLHQRITSTLRHGLRKLNLAQDRDGLVFVPESVTTGVPAPVLLVLHGAGGHAANLITVFEDLAYHTGTVLIAPESRASSWDMIRGVYGPDVRFIDRVLAETLGPTSAIVVDPSRFAIGGFSDGASYALSLGLTNGDVFSHVLAFSPGFMRPTAIHGAPEVFISHGDTDRVLNIDRCSRRLVQELRRINKSAALQYLEFKGGHTIPEAVARAAFERFLGAGDKTIEAEVEDSTVPAEESGVELT